MQENGYLVKNSALYTPKQNSVIERSGGVIQVKATKLYTMSGLPADLEVEAIKTAAYLLNHILTESLGFKTPLRYLYKYLKRELP